MDDFRYIYALRFVFLDLTHQELVVEKMFNSKSFVLILYIAFTFNIFV